MITIDTANFVPYLGIIGTYESADRKSYWSTYYQRQHLRGYQQGRLPSPIYIIALLGIPFKRTENFDASQHHLWTYLGKVGDPGMWALSKTATVLDSTPSFDALSLYTCNHQGSAGPRNTTRRSGCCCSSSRRARSSRRWKPNLC